MKILSYVTFPLISFFLICGIIFINIIINYLKKIKKLVDIMIFVNLLIFLTGNSFIKFSFISFFYFKLNLN